MIKDLQQYGDVFFDISLKDYNTYKIPGKTKYLVIPNDVECLIKLLDYLQEKDINYFILGNGSNIVISDGVYDGVIIKLSNFNDIEIDNENVYASAGVMLPTLCKKTIDNGLSGLEWACGIPGTIGGSIVGNAGAYKEAIFDYVTKVVILKNSKE